MLTMLARKFRNMPHIRNHHITCKQWSGSDLIRSSLGTGTGTYRYLADLGEFGSKTIIFASQSRTFLFLIKAEVHEIFPFYGCWIALERYGTKLSDFLSWWRLNPQTSIFINMFSFKGTVAWDGLFAKSNPSDLVMEDLNFFLAWVNEVPSYVKNYVI